MQIMGGGVEELVEQSGAGARVLVRTELNNSPETRGTPRITITPAVRPDEGSLNRWRIVRRSPGGDRLPLPDPSSLIRIGLFRSHR